MANLGANKIEHASEMELYNILPTLEQFLRWNQSVFNHDISADERSYFATYILCYVMC